MNTNDIATDKQASRVLSRSAFILFIVGVFLPLFRVAFRGVDITSTAIFIGVAAEILALVFGIMSRRSQLGKVAAIGAAIVCLIGGVNLVRFYLFL